VKAWPPQTVELDFMQVTNPESQSSAQSVQAQIDSINWYHDFEFPGGVRASTETPDKEFHRKVWSLIERNLEQIDMQGKSVLDIGCWDGYWSFFAERQGAQSVLATDDVSQNWAEGTGLAIAKSLFDSQIEVNQQVSVYDIASLDRKFDVILCMGVYYHLYDPFYAFSQIRHCCHPDTIVVFEGDVGAEMAAGTAEYCFDDAARPAFVPSLSFLQSALQAAYFDIVKTDYLYDRTVLAKLKHFAKVMMLQSPKGLNRILLTCKPFNGENKLHPYTPPVGLREYDPRFKE
jgi:tRNA (mo5U34)-methyltransferase